MLNLSVLDGWWAEGYNQKNGWAIGTNAEYHSYEEQDNFDSESLYNLLENKIAPIYYDRDEKGVPNNWAEMMKHSIISTGGEYSMARLIVDYTNTLYMPLCNLTKKYYRNLDTVTEFNKVKEEMYASWNDIIITQTDNLDNIALDAGKTIKVSCRVKLLNISVENIEAEAYYGRILDNGTIEDISIIPLKLVESDEKSKEYKFAGNILLKTGGEYGYTFRVMPKHEMILDAENLNLVKWIVSK